MAAVRYDSVTQSQIHQPSFRHQDQSIIITFRETARHRVFCQLDVFLVGFEHVHEHLLGLVGQAAKDYLLRFFWHSHDVFGQNSCTFLQGDANFRNEFGYYHGSDFLLSQGLQIFFNKYFQIGLIVLVCVPGFAENDAYPFEIKGGDHDGYGDELSFILFFVESHLFQVGVDVFFEFAALHGQFDEMIVFFNVYRLVHEEDQQICGEMDEFLSCEIELQTSGGFGISEFDALSGMAVFFARLLLEEGGNFSDAQRPHQIQQKQLIYHSSYPKLNYQSKQLQLLNVTFADLIQIEQLQSYKSYDSHFGNKLYVQHTSIAYEGKKALQNSCLQYTIYSQSEV